MKDLKDFPYETWVAASDGCPQCGAKYQVKVVLLQADGKWGNVIVKIEHSKSCTRKGSEPEYESAKGKWDVAGWEQGGLLVTLNLKRTCSVSVVSQRGNVALCVLCEKFIAVDAPMLIPAGEGKIVLCKKCALGLKRGGI